LLLNWIANNTDKKGIDKAISSIEESSKNDSEFNKKVENDWKKLSMMSPTLK